MPLEFKAELVNGELTVKAIVEKNGNDVVVHVPSFPLIQELKKNYGKRNLQSI